MSRVIVYIAASLDGYIARRDDDVSWLDEFQSPGEDYGYADFAGSVGTAIMGARTYAQSLKHPERLLRGMTNCVLSAKPMEVPEGLAVEFYCGELEALVKKIRGASRKDIWIVGGGKTVCSFLNAGLVDEVRHFVVPVLLKDGIALYAGLSAEIRFSLEEAVPYKTGIVKLRYAPVRSGWTRARRRH